MDRVTVPYKEFELINGKVIKVRPLTIKERKELSKIWEEIAAKKFKKAEDALEYECKILHFIVKTCGNEISEKELEEQVDSKSISEIIDFATKY